MLYEFRCPQGHEFEARKPVWNRHTAECPECGQIAEKKLSVVNFSFGWDRQWLNPNSGKDLVRDV